MLGLRGALALPQMQVRLMRTWVGLGWIRGRKAAHFRACVRSGDKLHSPATTSENLANRRFLHVFCGIGSSAAGH